MLGNFVNFLVIVVGSVIGLTLKGGIPKKISDTIMEGLALCVLFIGISGSLKGNNLLLIIISVVIGAIFGEIINIEALLERFANAIELKFAKNGGRFSEGFITASLLFSVGAMSITGALESGLNGNHQILYVKSLLDGVSSIIFSSSLGIGVIFSSITVFLYQGLIILLSSLLKGILVTSVINDITCIGSLLILALALNMLKATKIKVANLLPAVLIPIIYQVATIVLFRR